MSFKTAFPDYPEADMPGVFLAAPWTDGSWSQDSMPSFHRPINNGAFLCVFVDYVDAGKREITDGPRFMAWVSEESGHIHAELQTDDIAALLAWCDEQAAKTWPRAALTDAERAHFEGGRLV